MQGTDVYVLDYNLQPAGIVDNFDSLIWAERYDSEGDCELYITATAEYLQVLKKGYYLSRIDSEMVCQIKKIELDTDVENGNYLIVTGYDAKIILNQRIIWDTISTNGSAEDYARKIVQNNIVNPALLIRKISNFQLGPKNNFPETIAEQASYKNVGSKIREICKKFGWGYRVRVENGMFNFDLYKGADRSDSVIFSPDFENIISTRYQEDATSIANVALTAGEGEGAERIRVSSGTSRGIERHEIFVDARDISRTITYEELTSAYPTIENGGFGYIDSISQKGIVYKMEQIDIPVFDEAQLNQLKIEYPNGTEVIISGYLYYRIADATIADLESIDPTAEDNVTLRRLIYNVHLQERAYENMAEYGAVTSFEGSVDSISTFMYNRDYFLGDIVTVENEFGISVAARIMEVTEVFDSNGYQLNLKFEYLEEN